MNTIDKILLVGGFAIAGGIIYSIFELIYFLWKYKPKNVDKYKKTYKRIIFNSIKLTTTNKSIEELINILNELEIDAQIIKKELGFIAKRDLSDIWTIRRKLKSTLKIIFNNSTNNNSALVKRHVYMLGILSKEIIDKFENINKKVILKK